MLQDPLNEYEDLLSMERYPDPADEERMYPFMPPDFNPDDNVVNRNYELFERRFRDACHFFVCDITGRSDGNAGWGGGKVRHYYLPHWDRAKSKRCRTDVYVDYSWYYVSLATQKWPGNRDARDFRRRIDIVSVSFYFCFPLGGGRSGVN